MKNPQETPVSQAISKSNGNKREINQTTVVLGGVIVTGTVLLALMDGGLSNMVFQAVAGTSGYFVHDLTINDIPKELRHEAQEIAVSTRTMMTGSSVLAGIGIAADPVVGTILLVLSIGAHAYLDEVRQNELRAIDIELKKAAQEIGAVTY